MCALGQAGESEELLNGVERADCLGEHGIHALASKPEHNVLARLMRLGAAQQFGAGTVPDFPYVLCEQYFVCGPVPVPRRRVGREQFASTRSTWYGYVSETSRTLRE